MKDDKIKVSKIEIKIGDKTLSLTPEQALELRDILCDTFPTSRTVFVDRVPVFTAPVVTTPVLIPQPVWPSWPYPHWTAPVFICGGSGSSLAGSAQLVGQTLSLAATT